MTLQQEKRLLESIKILAVTGIDLNELAQEMGLSDKMASLALAGLVDDLIRVNGRLRALAQVTQMRTVSDTIFDKNETISKALRENDKHSNHEVKQGRKSYEKRMDISNDECKENGS